jgi:predicted RNA binding protein YcfA (HicA-like mRNA interferase family)
VRLPRDLSGLQLASSLHRYGYTIVRQTGSHIRLRSTLEGAEHHITIPSHKALSIGTLSRILTDVAGYLKMPRAQLAEELFPH